MATLEIRDLHASVEESPGVHREILRGVNLTVAEGEVDGYTIECWLHGSCFDLRTGRPTSMPATVPVPVYPVKIEGDDVLVSI